MASKALDALLAKVGKGKVIVTNHEGKPLGVATDVKSDKDGLTVTFSMPDPIDITTYGDPYKTYLVPGQTAGSLPTMRTLSGSFTLQNNLSGDLNRLQSIFSVPPVSSPLVSSPKPKATNPYKPKPAQPKVPEKVEKQWAALEHARAGAGVCPACWHAHAAEGVQCTECRKMCPWLVAEDGWISLADWQKREAKQPCDCPEEGHYKSCPGSATVTYNYSYDET